MRLVVDVGHEKSHEKNHQSLLQGLLRNRGVKLAAMAAAVINHRAEQFENRTGSVDS
jgi:hypothetical protein